MGSPRKAIWRGRVLQTPSAPLPICSSATKQEVPATARQPDPGEGNTNTNNIFVFLLVGAAAGALGTEHTSGGGGGHPWKAGLPMGQAGGSRLASGSRGCLIGRGSPGFSVNVARSDRQNSLARLHTVFSWRERFHGSTNFSQTPGEKPQAPWKHLLAGQGHTGHQKNH